MLNLFRAYFVRREVLLFMYVCVDIDGTLVDMQSRLKAYLAERGHDFITEAVTMYNFKCDCGVARDSIMEAFSDIELYKGLELFDGVEPALKKLRGIIEARAYTGSFPVEGIVTERFRLCQSLGLNGAIYAGIKKPTDMKAVALFDDCLEVMEQWIEDGSEAMLYLIDAPYNRRKHSDRIVRCRDFATAVERFISDFECV